VSQSVKGAVMLPILSWPKAKRDIEEGHQLDIYLYTPCNKNFISEIWSFKRVLML